MSTSMTAARPLAPPGDLLTTGEAAQLLGSTRQHVVDLCKRGDLPFATIGTHRRIRREDVERARSRTQVMTRDQRRSLWLAHAIAGKLVADPAEGTRIARTNLSMMRERQTRGRALRWLQDWEQLLDGPLDLVLSMLTSPTPRGHDLRQSAPFAGMLSESERTLVLDGWRVQERQSVNR